MKRLLLTLFISLSVLIAGAQKIYFVYVQTENRQPFYVKLNDKTYSSSATGYVILSRLRDTLFNISVGFPQNKWPEQKFSIEMRGKDHGYLLKNFDDGSWGLFDLQTTSLQIAPVQPKTGKAGSGEVSHFTQVLAKASNDPSLLEKPIPVKQEEKPAVVSQPEVLSETETVKNPPAIQKTAAKDEEVVAVKKEPTPQKPEDYKKSVVTKKFETSTTEGFGLVFIDEYTNGKKDTISIIIPELKEKAAKETLKEEKKFLDFETKVSGAQRMPLKLSADNDCEAASKDDFVDLRKKMSGQTTSQAMISEAEKYFSSKCFTVLQVKDISTLFVNDEEKLKFFSAAFSRVFDIKNFGSLQSELKDDYYINCFKAMLK